MLLFNGLEEVKILAKENNILVISHDMTKSSIDLKKQIEDNQNIKSIHRESDLIKYFYD